MKDFLFYSWIVAPITAIASVLVFAAMFSPFIVAGLLIGALLK